MNLPCNLSQIYRAGEEENRKLLERIVWPDGPDCPKCHSGSFYDLKKRRVYKCANCHKQYTWSSGSSLHSIKMSVTDLLAAMFLFSVSGNGVSSLDLHRLGGGSQQAAWLLLTKFREILHRDMLEITLNGEVEIDSTLVGGHLVRSNVVMLGTDVRFVKRHYVNRRLVAAAKQRGGRTVAHPCKKESEAVDWIVQVIQPASKVYADESRSWGKVADFHKLMRIKHKEAYWTPDACTNNVESFFSSLKRLFKGCHKWISGELLPYYAAEAAWRYDFGKLAAVERFALFTETFARQYGEQSAFRGYWQGTNTAPRRKRKDAVQLVHKPPQSIEIIRPQLRLVHDASAAEQDKMENAA